MGEAKKKCMQMCRSHVNNYMITCGGQERTASGCLCFTSRSFQTLHVRRRQRELYNKVQQCPEAQRRRLRRGWVGVQCLKTTVAAKKLQIAALKVDLC